MTGSTLLTYIFHRLMAVLLSNGRQAEIIDRCKQLRVNLGWEFDPKCDPAYEMDAVAVLTNSGGHIRHRLDLVTYDSENLITLDGEEHPCSYDESVIGPATYGDQEVAPGVGRVEFLVDLSKINESRLSISPCVCIGTRRIRVMCVAPITSASYLTYISLLRNNLPGRSCSVIS